MLCRICDRNHQCEVASVHDEFAGLKRGIRFEIKELRQRNEVVQKLLEIALIEHELVQHVDPRQSGSGIEIV